MFRQAKQSRIFQDVVEQIEDAILDGELEAGDRLPPERELKETLKTSRSTLREALRVLEQKGLIEMRLGMGGGAIVKAVSAKPMSQSLGLLIRSQKVSLGQLAEFRERFEGDIAALAASRHESCDTGPLHALLQEAKRCADGGDDQVDNFLRVDIEFHLGIARLTNNPIYITILETIHQNIMRYFKRYLMMASREMQSNLDDLSAVVKAIEEGDQEVARSVVQAHVSRFNAIMERHRHEIEDPGSEALE